MRNSDRWVTPGVVITALLGVVVCLLATIAAVTWLTARGLDPSPMLKLVAQVGSGLAGLLSLVLQLAQRRTVAKTEANTGLLATKTHELAGAVYEVADAMPRPLPRHGAEDTLIGYGAAPAPRGS